MRSRLSNLSSNDLSITFNRIGLVSAEMISSSAELENFGKRARFPNVLCLLLRQTNGSVADRLVAASRASQRSAVQQNASRSVRAATSGPVFPVHIFLRENGTPFCRSKKWAGKNWTFRFVATNLMSIRRFADE